MQRSSRTLLSSPTTEASRGLRGVEQQAQCGLLPRQTDGTHFYYQSYSCQTTHLVQPHHLVHPRVGLDRALEVYVVVLLDVAHINGTTWR